MPRAPTTHRPPGWQPKPERDKVRKRLHDDRRGTAHQRGYTQRWAEYSRAKSQRDVFCALCLTIGVETDITRVEKTDSSAPRQKPVGCTDHIIPVDGEDDPLFWEDGNHWSLCRACDSWKSINYDGGYGQAKKHAADRTLDGVAKRKAEVIRKFKEANR